MLASLHLGSVQLHETVSRSVSRVEGLTGPPGVRGAWVDRPEEDGWIPPAEQRLPGRIVIVHGELWGASIDTAWDEWDLLAKAFADALETDALLKWQHAGDAKSLQATVQLASEVLPPLEGGAGILAYQVQFRAADPGHYSQTLQSASIGSPTAAGGMPLPVVFPIPFGEGASGGSLDVTNSGNRKTWPKITIQGPISGPVVENTTQGKALYFDALSIAAGDSLIIDMNPASRSATVAGASVFGSLRWADSSFFTIAPNSTETLLFYGIGGGYGAGTAMTVDHRDAYIS